MTRAALVEGQSARGYVADAATILRSYMNLNETMPPEVLARVTLLIEAGIAKMDDEAPRLEIAR